MSRALKSQLAAIGYSPQDITDVAISHAHKDHSANLNQHSKSIAIDKDEYDVFGDGKVVIKAAPGHTPGHQALILQLASAGRVMIAGDLYHLSARTDAPSSTAQQRVQRPTIRGVTGDD